MVDCLYSLAKVSLSGWSAGGAGVGKPGFEVGDTPVLEVQVGAGSLEAFVQGAVVGGELADTLLECGVLGGDAVDRVLGPFGFQVADTAEQLADPCPLDHDLVVRGLERVLSVECTFGPARPHQRGSAEDRSIPRWVLHQLRLRHPQFPTSLHLRFDRLTTHSPQKANHDG